ncbi:MAG: cytochrome c-type biogenesis protein CcmH [Gammaproteobacteria bacterium]|uniref:Cytochrome c-type biogenesis protein n=1 Tax=Candidatus Thiopontia autotrophica TaxID=2841688 RepID=A0A8J6TQB8_9GAMM|nr:cytochrome c-type biogenesis protein CcmH [Candidatus Thiopontia autotrophica]
MNLWSMVKTVLAASLLLISTATNAAPIDSFSFNTQAEEDRYKALIEEIRCVKCQNTNIAGSNADLARDHRTKVYEMIQQGKTDTEIREWFVVRYGDFVLYRPAVDSRTWLLWGLPLLLVPIGGVMLVLQVRRQRKVATEEVAEETSLSADEQKQLDEVLK